MSGVLVVGYAPFLHAYNAVYYGAVLPCRSIGMVWLSMPFTLAVPLLGFALVALGAGFLAANRGPSRSPLGFDPEELADRLRLPLRLLAAVALVSGVGFAMSSEVYDREPLEGVHFTTPRREEWVTVALPAVVGLGVAGVGHRLRDSRRACAARAPVTARASRLAVAASFTGWLLPMAAVGRGGWDVHFDVPPGFVLVIEWALGLAVAAAWAGGASRSVLARLAAAWVLADLTRVIFGDSATALIYGRARDFTFYERQLFTVGRFVNGTVAMIWIAMLAGCCALLLRDSRLASPPSPSSAQEARAPRRSVSGRLAELAVWWFLLLSVAWFVFSISGLHLLSLHDRVVGECAPEGRSATGRTLAVVVSGLQIAAGWVLSMGAAHLMTSAAIELRTVQRGGASGRERSDARAWQAMLATALLLCVISLVRLGWRAAQLR
ncbi:MAG: hypothetical protein IPK07_35890 [Deltaproteobacteria bacterium]|nr:hypothetical protein [Deltaproteobacteria bacterium]